MTGQTEPRGVSEPLFYEPGARWRTVAFGPVFCAVALIVELTTGPVVHWVALPVLAIVLAGFAYVMVTAARRHVSVELTRTALRQGTEELEVGEIEAVLPPAMDSWDEPQRWESARVLGELANVPRGRTAVGLRLRGGTFVRAWAKDADRLRVRLGELVGA
ncbi:MULTISPECIES: hypothetical protein [unclassified Rhodococcus (in: high G+C Gram-positive bacteria)]|uniref:hypothetical protein n=1 Tax=Rhodococcus sp. SJ-3 TaxID=3454628 RepID=UPI002DB42B7C|nr:hypothetical protein [Rhodococcus sp. (in: high G+C Gram-positive bacteria)]